MRTYLPPKCSGLVAVVVVVVVVGASLGLACLAACGPSSRGDDAEADGGPPLTVDAGDSDAPGTAAGVIYAHDDTKLYRFDPRTHTIAMVAPFQWPGGNVDSMTDIAINRDGLMIGISFDKVYRVDPATAACIKLADLGASFNGLSFIEREVGQGEEELVATTLDGQLYSLDSATGSSTLIGAFGGGWGSSGDVVSVLGYGTLVTVDDGFGDVSLATLDPTTGHVTPIGNGTGAADLWGLAFWGGEIFAFGSDGLISTIDPESGVATPLANVGISFWGAAVTTIAPID
jgi:hypothetical protein